jgi:ArsR family metal-binding transcriptional regulator
MFLSSIALWRTLPCLAEPGKIIVVGKPARSLDEVLPYLATLPDVIAYNPDGPSLTFRRRAGLLTLYADKVYITQVSHAEEGLELLAALTEATNATWEHREELVAMTTRRRAPQLLDVWRFLPQTNCRECGETTCMAFAAGLIQGKRVLEHCRPMQDDPALAERLAALAVML